MKELKQCPKCGKMYQAPPALSRVDNKTYICPDCGTLEALESIGIKDKNEQAHILNMIHGYKED